MAALPFGLAALYARVDPALHDSPAAWILLAVAVVWGVPGHARLRSPPTRCSIGA